MASRTRSTSGSRSRTQPSQGRRRTPVRRRRPRLLHGVLVAVLVLIAGAYGVLHSLILPNIDNRWETCTVTNLTATTVVSSGHSAGTDYRIYTAQCDVIQDHDSMLRGKADSATLYGQMHIGETYRFHLVGVRFAWTSNFPNALDAIPLAFQPAAPNRH